MTDFLSTDRRERLKRNLDELPDLMALVETSAATLLPRRGQQGGGRPTPGSRPPVNLTLIDLRDERPKFQGRYGGSGLDTMATSGEDLSAAIALECGQRREGVLACLGTWVRIAAEEMDEDGTEHTEPADDPTMTTEAGWLSQHLGWIVRQQWVTELEQDIRRIHRDLQTVVGEGRPEYHPRCPNCRGRMDDEGAFFTCRECGHQVRDQAMDHRTALANEHPIDAYSFGAFGVTPQAVWQWVQRGLLEPAAGDDGRVLKSGKRILYHPLDVLRLAETSPA